MTAAASVRKLCKECKHYGETDNIESDYCFLSEKPHPVNGEPMYISCVVFRSDMNVKGLCGDEAKYFTPQEVDVPTEV